MVAVAQPIAREGNLQGALCAVSSVVIRNGSWLLEEKRNRANVNLWTGLFPPSP